MQWKEGKVIQMCVTKIAPADLCICIFWTRMLLSASMQIAPMHTSEADMTVDSQQGEDLDEKCLKRGRPEGAGGRGPEGGGAPGCYLHVYRCHVCTSTANKASCRRLKLHWTKNVNHDQSVRIAVFITKLMFPQPFLFFRAIFLVS